MFLLQGFYYREYHGYKTGMINHLILGTRTILKALSQMANSQGYFRK